MPEVRLMKTQSILAHSLRDIGRYRDAMHWLEEARAVFDAAHETPLQRRRAVDRFKDRVTPSRIHELIHY